MVADRADGDVAAHDDVAHRLAGLGDVRRGQRLGERGAVDGDDERRRTGRGQAGDDGSAGEADDDLTGATGSGRTAGAHQDLAVLDGPRLETGGDVGVRVRDVGPAAPGRRHRMRPRSSRPGPRRHSRSRPTSSSAAAVRAILMRGILHGFGGVRSGTGAPHFCDDIFLSCPRGSVPHFGSRSVSVQSSRSRPESSSAPSSSTSWCGRTTRPPRPRTTSSTTSTPRRSTPGSTATARRSRRRSPATASASCTSPRSARTGNG